jgi:hypothetical protein
LLPPTAIKKWLPRFKNEAPSAFPKPDPVKLSPMQAHAPASPSVTNDTNATTNTKANGPFGNIDVGQMVATYLQT